MLSNCEKKAAKQENQKSFERNPYFAGGSAFRANIFPKKQKKHVDSEKGHPYKPNH